MKKLLFFLIIFISYNFSVAQTTAVTATITDSDSTVWTNATVNVSFVPNPNIPNLSEYSINGTPISTGSYAQYLQQKVISDGSTGVISVTLLDGHIITPSGSTWRFVVSPNASVQAVAYNPIAVYGTSYSLTTYLSANSIAPRFSAINQAYGYSDAEVSPIPNAGGFYFNTTSLTQRIWNGSSWQNGGGGGSSLLSQKVVYVSKLTGIPASVVVTPGSSASATTDSASIINTAISGGNVDLEVDGGYALSTSLVVSSNTTIHCIAPQYGFIMQTAANAPVLVNAHENAPTTISGTGGYLVSNQTDQDIKINNCQLNANSVQSITGSGNPSGTPHTTNPTTGYWMMGVQLIGINDLILDHNEIYDSGTYVALLANDSNVHLESNYVHQPTPLTAFKNTDGFHFVGPDQYLYETNNKILAGDDSMPFNADDGNEVSDPGAYPSFVKWGWITDVFADNNSMNGSYYGLRLFSGTELIDRVQINNTSGVLCGNTGLVAANTAIGSGNFGNVKIDGWQVQTTGTCNNYSVPYNFLLSGNANSVQIDGVQIANPTVNWPVLSQTGGAIKSLSLHNWDLTTTNSTFSDVIALSSGTLKNIVTSGMSWADSLGTGNFFSGATVPATLTCSNYAGPNLLLASGFVPSIENGDCFTNTYATTTTYMATTFSEHASGNLAGTTPATVNSPASGTWTLASGTDQTYQSGGVGSTTVNDSNDLFSVGLTNYTLRFGVTTCTGVCQVALRFTDANDFIAINIGQSGNQFWLFDCISGSCTPLEVAPTATETGNWAVTVNGTSVTVTSPTGTFGPYTTANTGTKVGMGLNTGGTAVLWNSFSVKSN